MDPRFAPPRTAGERLLEAERRLPEGAARPLRGHLVAAPLVALLALLLAVAWQGEIEHGDTKHYALLDAFCGLALVANHAACAAVARRARFRVGRFLAGMLLTDVLIALAGTAIVLGLDPQTMSLDRCTDLECRAGAAMAAGSVLAICGAVLGLPCAGLWLALARPRRGDG